MTINVRPRTDGKNYSRGLNCGACTVCCTTLTIHALNKPAGVPCEHLTAQGCGIYDQRPDECRVFDCGWKIASLKVSPKLRPDRAGFMIYPQPASKPTTLVLFKNVIGVVNSIAVRKVKQLAKRWDKSIRWSHTCVDLTALKKKGEEENVQRSDTSR